MPERSEPVRFTIPLALNEVGTFVIIPDDVVRALGATGRTSVAGSIDGRPFSNQIMPYRDGSPAGRQFYMPINRGVRALIGKRPGEDVEFELKRDDAPREVPVPDELRAALRADERVAAVWAALPPSHRREHSSFVADAKRAETRARRVEQTLERIRRRAT